MMKISFKSVISTLKNRWIVKCLSLLIAVVVWLIIVRYVNPEDTRVLNDINIYVEMEESVPEAEGLVLVTELNEKLSVTYTATRDVIAVLNTEKITARVDVSSVTKSGEYNLPVKIDTGNQSINIINQSVNSVNLKFEKSAKAQIGINVIAEGSVPEGYVKNDPVCLPAVINIEGPESKKSKIASAKVVIDEAKFVKTGVYTSEYVFVDENGNEIDKNLIVADTETLDVTISVLKSKSIPITAKLVNSSGGNESEFVKLEIEPAEIAIAGGEETIDALNGYDLGSIDLAEIKNDFEKTYDITLQSGVKNLNGVEKATVKIVFAELSSKTIVFNDFKIENLAEGQKAKIVERSLSVTFRGVPEDIEKINSSNIKLVVDLKNNSKSVGANSVPVYAVIPESYKVGVSGKHYLTVNLT